MHPSHLQSTRARHSPQFLTLPVPDQTEAIPPPEDFLALLALSTVSTMKLAAALLVSLLAAAQLVSGTRTCQPVIRSCLVRQHVRPSARSLARDTSKPVFPPSS